MPGAGAGAGAGKVKNDWLRQPCVAHRLLHPDPYLGYSTNPDPGTKKDKHFKKSISIGIYYLFEMDPFGIKLGTVLSHQP